MLTRQTMKPLLRPPFVLVALVLAPIVAVLGLGFSHRETRAPAFVVTNFIAPQHAQPSSYVVAAETFTATNIVGTATITTPSYVLTGGTTPTIAVCNADPPTSVAPSGSVCLDTTGTPSLYQSQGAGTWSKVGGAAGTGTTNTIPVWTGTATLGNSLLTDDATTLSYNGVFSVQSSTGVTAISGGVTASAQFALPASISPTALTTTTNNYNPPGLSTTYVVRQDSTGSQIVTGLAALPAGTKVVLRNTSANTLTLTHLDPLSISADEFLLPNQKPWVLPPFGAVELQYDGVVFHWMVTSSNNNNGTFTNIQQTTGFTANALTKYDGTGNFVATDITQSGGFVDTPLAEQVRITTSLAHGTTTHGALTVFTEGVALANGEDGGIQSFNSSTVDTTAGAHQTIGVYAGNTATKSTGGNSLTNYAVYATASGGDSNFSFFGANGNMFNQGAVSFNTTLQVTGVSTLTGGITVPNGSNPVALGTDVGPFTMPSGVQAAIAIGDPAVNNIIDIRNTGGTQRFVGIDLQADTTRNASALPNVTFRRSAGGSTTQGFVEVTDGSVYSSANDLIVGANTGQAVVLVAGNVNALKVDSSQHLSVAGAGTTAPTMTSCGTSPAIQGNDEFFKLTTGATATTCTITFNKTYTNAPACTTRTEGGTTPPTCTISATAITCTVVASATIYDWHCVRVQ